MGRHISRAPETKASARAYVVTRWTAPVVDRVDKVLLVQHRDLEIGSRTNALNERSDVIRQLGERLNARAGLPVAVRDAAHLVDEIVRQTARIETEFGTPRGGPTREDIDALRKDAAEFHAAFLRLREWVSRSQGVAMYGTADAMRNVADALDAYNQSPNATTRRALGKALRLPALGDRVAFVQRAVNAAPRLARASATEWAHYAIWGGLDLPCNSAQLAGERREAWREIQQRAAAAPLRFCGAR
jgi:hypothetical protein